MSQSIIVEVIDETGNIRNQKEIPARTDIPIKRLIPIFAKALKLHTAGQYFLEWEHGGNRIHVEEETTLASHGVTAGSRLCMVSLEFVGRSFGPIDLLIIVPPIAATREGQTVISSGTQGVHTTIGVLVEVLHQFNMSVIRTDEIFDVTHYTQQIRELIVLSSVIVADCTGADADVMYSIGVASELNKPIVRLGEEANSTYDGLFRDVIRSFPNRPGSDSGNGNLSNR